MYWYSLSCPLNHLLGNVDKHYFLNVLLHWHYRWVHRNMEMVRASLSLRHLRFHSLRAYRWMVMRILARNFLDTNQMDLHEKRKKNAESRMKIVGSKSDSCNLLQLLTSFTRFYNCNDEEKKNKYIRIKRTKKKEKKKKTNEILVFRISDTDTTEHKIKQIKCELCENKIVSKYDSWFDFSLWSYFFFVGLLIYLNFCVCFWAILSRFAFVRRWKRG